MYLFARTIGIDFERQFDKRNPAHLVGEGAAGSRTTMPLPNGDIPPEKQLTSHKFPARLNRTWTTLEVPRKVAVATA